MDTVLQGRSGKTVVIGAEHPFCIIGERINPTGRKKFAEELRAGDLSTFVVYPWGDPEARLLKPWARVVVTLWVLVVVPMLAFALVMMVLTLPRVIGTS